MFNSTVTDAAPLPQQLLDLQRRSRTVLTHDLIGHSTAGVLHHLGQTLLGHLRRIQEIRRATATRIAAGESGELTVANLVRIAHRLLDTIQGQLSFCEATVRQSSVLAEWAQRLVAQERVPYPQLLPLFSRTLDEIATAPTLSRLTPLAGLAIVKLVNSQVGPAAALFVEGLTAARVLAWAMHADGHGARRLPTLVLAALWQDIGRLQVGFARAPARPSVPERMEVLDRLHPAIGAGILGTISGAPVELALMVGQHHERLDARGYPRALSAREILPDSAILAAATRFARLVLEPELEPSAAAGDQSVPARVARILLEEAEAGLWPLDFARRLSQRVAETGEEAAPSARDLPPLTERPSLAGELEPSVAEPSDRSRRLHGREPGLPSLHSGFGRRCSEPGWYEKKMLIDRESR